MLTWMQRHKKYLVVTIWISVIAFVGAGFVGFGSVDLNTSRAKYVAKVGDIGITYKEFQNKFNETYSLQSQFSNKELTQELALQLGLDKQALSSLVQNKLLLNYSKDLGFFVSDSEVLDSLLKEDYFKKEDGSFDKEKYFNFLKNVGMKAKEFESKLNDDIMVGKLLDLLKAPVDDEELEMIAASLFMQDEINMKIIDLSKDKSKILISEKELKDYWEENKEEYKSERTFEYSFVQIFPYLNLDEKELEKFWEENKFNYKNDEGKIKEFKDAKEQAKIDFGLKKVEKEANLKYIDLKKSNANFEHTTVEQENSKLNLAIKKLKLNEISKPFIFDNSYYIVRLDKINEPKALEFKDAKKLANDDLVDKKFAEKLQTVAEEELKKDKINGKNIGFISKDSKNITDLTDIEFYTFINELFSKNVKKSFVLLNDKVVVYEILSQILLDKDRLEKNKDSLKKELDEIKQRIMINDLLEELIKRYKVVNFYKEGKIN